MAVWDKTLFETMYSCNGWPYGIRGSSRVPRFHYNWFGMIPATRNVVDMYVTMPGFAQLSDVAIIGGGYGWTAELLSTYSINAISIDTSPHIINTKDTSEEAEIRDYLTQLGFDPDRLNDGPAGIRFMSPDDPNAWVNPWDYWLRADGVRTAVTVVDEDLSTNGSRRNVRQALGNNIDGILTEIVLDSMETENDALVFIERCEQLRPNPAVNVVHLVMDGHSDPRFLSYTKEQWRALLDANGYNHWVVNLRGTILSPGG